MIIKPADLSFANSNRMIFSLLQLTKRALIDSLLYTRLFLTNKCVCIHMYRYIHTFTHTCIYIKIKLNQLYIYLIHCHHPRNNTKSQIYDTINT